jgi:hypothetical protein
LKLIAPSTLPTEVRSSTKRCKGRCRCTSKVSNQREPGRRLAQHARPQPFESSAEASQGPPLASAVGQPLRPSANRHEPGCAGPAAGSRDPLAPAKNICDSTTWCDPCNMRTNPSTTAHQDELLALVLEPQLAPAERHRHLDLGALRRGDEGGALVSCCVRAVCMHTLQPRCSSLRRPILKHPLQALATHKNHGLDDSKNWPRPARWLLGRLGRSAAPPLGVMQCSGQPQRGPPSARSPAPASA